jgi:hypothetical protein
MPARPASATIRAAAVDPPCAVRDPSCFDGIRQPQSLGRFLHRREPIFLDGGRAAAPGAQRAALYSIALFDLATGPVTVTLPHPGRRQMTLTAMDERHALQAVYNGPGAHTLNCDRLGASRVMAVFCLMLDLAQSNELARAQALQDAIRIRQAARRGSTSHWTTFQAPLAL